MLPSSSPVTFKWLLFQRKTVQAFIKALARLLQVLPQLPGGNMVPGVSALGVINPGTRKEAFAAGCVAGPLLMPAPVGQLRFCSRCFPLACLDAKNARESGACYTYCIQYTMHQCAVAPESLFWKGSNERVRAGSANKPTGNTFISQQVWFSYKTTSIRQVVIQCFAHKHIKLLRDCSWRRVLWGARSGSFVQTEVSQQLLDGLSRNFVQTISILRGSVLLTSPLAFPPLERLIFLVLSEITHQPSDWLHTIWDWRSCSHGIDMFVLGYKCSAIRTEKTQRLLFFYVNNCIQWNDSPLRGHYSLLAHSVVDRDY